MKDGPMLKTVPQIYVPSLSVPKINAPKVRAPIPKVPYKGNYTPEPHQHIKDLGDILLGNPLTGTKQLQMQLRDAGLERWIYVPIINRIIGTGLAAYERGVKPVIEGKPGVALVNYLETAGNTLNILSNPVKSLFSSAGGGSGNDFLRSMGWMDNEYRKIYQFNTGNFIADLALETITDPLTYISFGTSAAASSGAKETASAMTELSTETLTKAIGKEAATEVMKEIDENAIRKIIQELGVKALDNPDAFYAMIQSQLTARELNLSTLIAGMSESSAEKIANQNLLHNVLQAKDLLTKQQIANELAALRFTDGYKKFMAATKISKARDILNQSANLIVPTGMVTGLFMERIIKPQFKAIWKKTISMLKNYDINDLMKRPNFVLAEAQEYLKTRYSAFNRNTANIMINADNAVAHLYAIMNEASLYHAGDNKWIRDEFYKYIQHNLLDIKSPLNAEISNLTNDLLLYSAETGKLDKDLVFLFLQTQNDLVKDVADTLIDVGISNEALKSVVHNTVRTARTADFNTWRSKEGMSKLTELLRNYIKVPEETLKNIDMNSASPIERILYVRNRLFQNNFSINRLKELIQEPDNTLRSEYIALLNWAGITIDNLYDVDSNLYLWLDALANKGEYNTEYLEGILNAVQSIQTDFTSAVPSDLHNAYTRFIKETQYDIHGLAEPFQRIFTSSTVRKTTDSLSFYDAIKAVERDNKLTKAQKNTKIKLMYANKDLKRFSKLNIELNKVRDALIAFDQKDYSLIQDIHSIPYFLKPYSGATATDSEKLLAFLEHPIFKFFPNTTTTASTISAGNKALELMDDFVRAKDEILTNLRYWNYALSNPRNLENSPIKNTPQLITFLKDLYDILTSDPATDTFDDIVQVVQEANTAYTMKLQLAKIFQITNAELNHMSDASLKKLFDVTSDTRLALDKLRINMLSRPGEEVKTLKPEFIKEYKEYISKGLKVPDAWYTVTTANDYYKSLGSTITNIVVDLDSHRNLGELERLWKLEVKTLAKQHPEMFDNYMETYLETLAMDKLIAFATSNQRLNNVFEARKYVKDIVDNYMQQLSWYNKDKTYMFKNLNLTKEMKRNAKLSDEVLTEVRLRLTTLYDKYMNDQVQIAKRYNLLVVPTVKWLDEQTSKNLQLITDLNEDFIENLPMLNVNAKEQESILDFIQTLTHQSSQAYKQDAYNFIVDTDTYIPNINSDKIMHNFSREEIERNRAVLKNLDKLAVDHVNVTLTDVLHKTYHYVGMMNNALRGSGTDLGTLYRAGYLDDGFVQTIRNFTRWANVVDTERALEKVGEFANIYDFSIANGTISFKKIYDESYANLHKISLKDLNDTDLLAIKNNQIRWSRGSEYMQFYNHFNAAIENANKYLKISINDTMESEYWDLIKNKLIEIYNNKQGLLAYAPLDPSFYFNNLSPEDLIAWHKITKSMYLNRSIANEYGSWFKRMKETWATEHKRELQALYEQSVKDRRRISANASVLMALEILDTDDTIKDEFVESFTYDNAFINRAINNMANNELIAMQTNSLESLSKLFLDDRTALRNENVFYKYIKNDIRNINNLNPVIDMVNDTRKISNYKFTKEQLYELNLHGITEDTLVSDQLVHKYLQTERCMAIVASVENWTNEQLASYLDKTGGLLVYQFIPYSDVLNSKWLDKVDELSNVGIELAFDKDDPSVLLFIKKQKTNNNVEIPWIKPTSLFPDLQETITNAFKNNTEVFEDTVIPFELFTGDMIVREEWTPIKENLIEALDKRGLTYLQDTIKNLADDYLKDSTPRQLSMVLGNRGFYDSLLKSDIMMKYYQINNMEPILRSTSLIKSALAGTYTAVHGRNEINKYISFFFPRGEFQLGGQFWQDITKEINDDQIKRLFAHNNYAAVLLKEDRKGLPRVYKLMIENRKDLEHAIKAGAIGIPYEIYRNMVLVVNKREAENGFIKFYKHILMPLYKTIAISTPGMILRNGLDSDLFKNAYATDGMRGVVDTLKYEVQAARDLDWYDKAYQKLIAKAEERGALLPNKDEVVAFFETLNKEDKLRFYLITEFRNSGASSGLTDSLAKQLIEYNIEKSADRFTKADYAIRTWKLLIGGNPYVAGLHNINDLLEDSARYGLVLKMLNEGSDVPAAFKNTINTHIDYGYKMFGSDFIENMFWFSTFPINNFMFYTNTGMQKNPELLKLQLDALRLSWNDGEDYTWDRVKNSDYLMYNVLAGNIRIKIAGKNVLLKTGSSFMDYMSILYDPLGAVAERLNPFGKVLINPSEYQRLNPFLTPISRVQQIISGQSYAPSIYSILNDKYKPRWYVAREPYVRRSSGWTAKPKKIPKRQPNYYTRVSKILTRRFSDQFRFNRYYWKPQNKPTVYIQSKRAAEHAARIKSTKRYGRKYMTNRLYSQISRNIVNKRNTI